ncbi:MAG TPA: hypothetical protein VK463_02540 [Desulfomonilaceae bacterium]|nr:hypothetical protein [Desulfomonilaceae bacterium]
MPRQSALQRAKFEIADFFESQDAQVFSRAELGEILASNRKEWGLSPSMTFSRFNTFLIEELGFRLETCSFPSRNYTKFTFGEVPTFDFLLSLIPNSYLSHHTALFLHKLSDKIPDKVYLNVPQERKLRKNSSLDQGLIDRAFRGSVRISKNSAAFRGKEVLLLNSMGRGDLGIIESEGPDDSMIRITDMERTLIDITVRPVYSGGISNVLAAYTKAKGIVSISKLAETLKALDFAYPYHQSIGFCLERAGYEASETDVLRDFPIRYDFYLDYQMTETEYSQVWRLYFPKGLE